jgi:hypothetical protein
MQDELAERSSDLVHVVAVHSDHSTNASGDDTARHTPRRLHRRERGLRRHGSRRREDRR